MTIVAAAHAMAHLARQWLARGNAAERLGGVTLRPHQRRAVERLARMLHEHGGALLADDVGLGKTYVATALAARAKRVLLVVPAALRDMWREALSTTGVVAEVVTHSALSRGAGCAGPFDLVIVDEAHHVRTPSTQRYARLAQLCTGARVLLLSATPLHNARSDVAALLALFLGARAYALDDGALSTLIVRREREQLPDGSLPTTAHGGWLAVPAAPDILDAILALPPPVPPVDGGDGGALVSWSLVRQWASSHRALTDALRRRLTRAAALECSLAEGRHPSHAELRAWCVADDVVQLPFPGLFALPEPCAPTLVESVRAHADGVRTLLDLLRRGHDPDHERAAHLRALRLAHLDEKIVAFAEHESTVRGLYAHLSGDGQVAALSGRGGVVTGGRLSRREILRRFAPRASLAAAPRPGERIDLLLTTDLLSEGVNLQDASVVVHLDLPWTPARLEQRVGRSRRLGAHHQRTTVYAMAPPAAAETLLSIERRLAEKLRAAGRTLGVCGTILPTVSVQREQQSAATWQRERIAQLLERWLVDPPCPPAGAAPWVCAVHAERRGWLALLREGDAPLMAAAVDDDRPTEHPAAVLAAVQLLSERQTVPESLSEREDVTDSRPDADPSTLDRALRDVQAFVERRAAARSCVPIESPARRLAIRRIARIASHATFARRATMARLATDARRVATAHYGVGAERVLSELVAAPLPDEAWLRAIGEFVRIQRNGAEEAATLPQLEVLVVMLGDDDAGAARKGNGE